jgi:hypothetical protein
MKRTKGARPFYEQRWFQGTAAVLGMVAVVFSLIGPPNLWDAIANLFSDELPPSDTRYVVDASPAMGAPFGSGEGDTKLSAAAETIAAAVARSLEDGGASGRVRQRARRVERHHPAAAGQRRGDRPGDRRAR